MTSYQKELQALRDGSKRPENYGKPWTDKEISELRALFLQCYDISYLAVLFGRTEVAVYQQLQKERMFSSQCPSRDTGGGKQTQTHDRCGCPTCTVMNCPNRGKEFCHAGDV